MKPTNKINLFALICIIAILAAAGVFAQETVEEGIDYEHDPAVVANPYADYSKVNWDVADQSLVPSSRVWEVPVDRIKVEQIADKLAITQQQWAFGSNLNFVDDFSKYESARGALQERHPGTALDLAAGPASYKDGFISSPKTPPQRIDNFRGIAALPDGTLLLDTGEIANKNQLEGKAEYSVEAGKETTLLYDESRLARQDGVEVDNFAQATLLTETAAETTVAGQAFVADKNGKGVVGSYTDGKDIYLADGVLGLEGNSRYGVGAVFSHEQDVISVSMPDSDIMILAENSKMLALLGSFVTRLPDGAVSQENIRSATRESLKDVYGADLKGEAEGLRTSLEDAVGFKAAELAKLRTGVSLLDVPLGAAGCVIATVVRGEVDVVNLETNDKTAYLDASIKLDSSMPITPERAAAFSVEGGVRSDVLGDVQLRVEAMQQGTAASAYWNVLKTGVNLGVDYVPQSRFDDAVVNLQLGFGAKF